MDKNDIVYTVNGEPKIEVSVYEIIEYLKNNKPTH